MLPLTLWLPCPTFLFISLTPCPKKLQSTASCHALGTGPCSKALRPLANRQDENVSLEEIL